MGRVGDLSGVRDGRWKQACDYMLIEQDGEKSRVLFIDADLKQAEAEIMWLLREVTAG